MIQRSIKRLSWRALGVDDELPAPTAEGRATRALVEELLGRALEVVEAASREQCGDRKEPEVPRALPRSVG